MSEQNLTYDGKGHIALVGATNSGKTTNLITQLFFSGLEENSGPFKAQYEYFFNVSSAMTKEDTVNNLRDSAICLLSKKTNNFNNNFAYFTQRKFSDAIQQMTDTNVSNENLKLCFFDDVQAIVASKDAQNLAAFISQAKNANCHVIVTMHKIFNIDKNEIRIRNAIRYFCLFNISEQEFKRVINMKSANVSANDYLWRKFSSEEDVYKRIVIYDSLEDKLYWGYPPYSRFDPLIENNNVISVRSKSNKSSASSPSTNANRDASNSTNTNRNEPSTSRTEGSTEETNIGDPVSKNYEKIDNYNTGSIANNT